MSNTFDGAGSIADALDEIWYPMASTLDDDCGKIGIRRFANWRTGTTRFAMA
ncbi:hypothetical protein [Burkholderia pyrrocinia]